MKPKFSLFGERCKSWYTEVQEAFEPCRVGVLQLWQGTSVWEYLPSYQDALFIFKGFQKGIFYLQLTFKQGAYFQG